MRQGWTRWQSTATRRPGGPWALLERFLTDPDGDVFALTGLPEVVKGAVFARYSRSPAGVKDLLIDEFASDLAEDGVAERADALYAKVFGDYGDDSVAQLGGAHVALEGVSNVATKRIEWGRLAAYLEQSTRYIAYDQRIDGRYRYHREATIMAGPTRASLRGGPRPSLRHLRRAAARRDRMGPRALPARRRRRASAPGPLRRARRARPAARAAAGGDDGERRDVRLGPGLRVAAAAPRRRSARRVARARRASLLRELRKVIPSFVARVDRPDRGHVWRDYLATTREDTRALAARTSSDRRRARRAGHARRLVAARPGRRGGRARHRSAAAARDAPRAAARGAGEDLAGGAARRGPARLRR
jgi:hypothetical protein